MTVKHEKRITNSTTSGEESLQYQTEQARRGIHEFLGLLRELASEKSDHTSPHYRKVIKTTLHSIPVITAQLETLNQSLVRERLIHNDQYVPSTQCISTVSKSDP